MKKKIALLDIGAIPNPIFINGSPNNKSFYCSIISIIFIMIMTIYSVNKLATLGTVVSYEKYEIKNYPEISINDIKFNLSIELIDLDKPYRVQISNKNMFRNGINITAVVINKNENQVDREQYYLEEIEVNNSKFLFALPQNMPKKLQTVSVQKYKNFYINISKCDDANPACSPLTKQLKRFIFVQQHAFIYDSVSINNSNIIPERRVWSTNIFLDRTWSHRKKTLKFNAYELYSDQSYLPKIFGGQRTIKSWCYDDLDDVVTSNNENGFYMIEFQGKRTTEYATEKMEKLDQILPQIFTVFSLVTLTFTIFSRHYRQWQIKMLAAHRIYGKKHRPRDSIIGSDQRNLMGINIANYLRYLLKRKQRGPMQKKTEMRLRKINKKLDYIEMSKKIHVLEKMVRILLKRSNIEKSEATQNVLMEPQSGEDESPFQQKLHKKEFAFYEQELDNIIQ